MLSKSELEAIAKLGGILGMVPGETYQLSEFAVGAYNEIAHLTRKLSDKEAEVGRLREDFEAVRDEMKAIALAIGRSKTDGESDCIWFDMAGDVAELANAADTAFQQGAEAAREAAARVANNRGFREGSDQCHCAAQEIRSMPLPTRGGSECR